MLTWICIVYYFGHITNLHSPKIGIHAAGFEPSKKIKEIMAALLTRPVAPPLTPASPPAPGNSS
jgi:hypothetical protein